MKTRFIRMMLTLLMVLLAFGVTAQGESYSASTMRLMRHDGDVVIEDASGNPRFVMDNVRFSSGETVRTSEGSSASVSLDATKIVTLDENSSVTFVQNGSHMELTLTEGTLFLDVSEKLDENETLDIKTSTMMVGIRGTITVVSVMPKSQLPGIYGLNAVQTSRGDGQVTVFGVLEGSAQITSVDGQTATVNAGQIAVVSENAEIAEMTKDNVTPFIRDQFVDDNTASRVMNSCPQLFEDYDFPADGDWEYTGKVLIIAQSASKLYDGNPLTRTGDILVYNLPELFDITASAVGSITDAGTAENPIGPYAILNKKGENVTSHFNIIETIAGQLVVDPAPMTIWTGDATKTYDGTPLTNEEAGFDLISGNYREEPWRNTSLVLSEAEGETLYGLSGELIVHGTNPLTGETSQIVLGAGEKLTVHLSDEAKADSITFNIEKISEEEIPDEVLRLYSDNPELLAQACEDTGWDEEKVLERIGLLPQHREPTTVKDGLTVSVSYSGGLMRELSNARINVDSDITDYNGRALTGDEARFAEVRIDDSVKVTAIGSRTEVGESENSYEIDWGNEKKSNFIVSEELGTLRVLPPLNSVTITAGSVIKTYDGTPVNMTESVITGLPEGYSITAEVTGSLTNAGTQKTEIESYRVFDPNGEDVTEYYPNLELKTGTITIEPAPLSVSTGSAKKVYDGIELTMDEASITGLINGETATITANGTLTDAGNADNSYEISWGSAKAENYTINEDLGTLTVEPLGISISMGSSAVGYSGSQYVPNPAVTYTNGEHAGETVPGTRLRASEIVFTYDLFTGESIELTISGSGIDAGSYDISTELRFSGSAGNYTVPDSASLDFTLTIEPAALSISTSSASKEYDGTALTSDEVSVDGLKGGDSITVTATGTITEVGNAENTYTIDWGDVNAENYVITEDLGTLTVDKNTAPVTITAASASKPFDGTGLADGGYSVSGLPDGLECEASVSGWQLRLGSSDNVIDSYTIYSGSEDVTALFTNVTTEKGTLTVTTNDTPIVITYDSFSVAYGETIYPSSWGTFTGVPSGLHYGMGASLDSQVVNIWLVLDVGTYEIEPSYYISYVWENGAAFIENVTSCFTNIEVITGTVTITPAPLTVSTGSGSKTYDGTELTNSEATLTGLVNGETATVAATGTVTDAGTVSNTYTISWGTAKESNYSITENLGTLDVTPLDVNIVIADSVYTFNNGYNFVEVSVSSTADCSGEILGDSAYRVRVLDAMFQGTFSSSAKRKDAGSDPISLSIDSWTFGNPSNYSVSVQSGSLTVKPCPITVTTGSASKIYDGTPLTCSEATVTGLTNGEGIRAIATGSITYVGSVSNTYTMDWYGWLDTNYLITENLGTLEILPDVESEEPTPQLNLNKTVTSTPANGTAYTLGETITYKITATNEGNLTLTNIIVVINELGSEWTIEALAPADSRTFTYSYVVTEADVTAGNVFGVPTM